MRERNGIPSSQISKTGSSAGGGEKGGQEAGYKTMCPIFTVARDAPTQFLHALGITWAQCFCSQGEVHIACHLPIGMERLPSWEQIRQKKKYLLHKEVGSCTLKLKKGRL